MKVEINKEFPSIKIDGVEVIEALRPMERKLFIFLYEYKNQICTTQKILDAVWGYAAAVETQTVKTHIGCLRKRLAGTSCEEAIQTIPKLGYRFKEDAQFVLKPGYTELPQRMNIKSEIERERRGGGE